MTVIRFAFLLLVVCLNGRDAIFAQACEPGSECPEGGPEKEPSSGGSIHIGEGHVEGPNGDGSYSEFHTNEGTIYGGSFRDTGQRTSSGGRVMRSEYGWEISGDRGNSEPGGDRGGGVGQGAGSGRGDREGHSFDRPVGGDSDGPSEPGVSIDSEFAKRPALGLSIRNIQVSKIPTQEMMDKLNAAFPGVPSTPPNVDDFKNNIPSPGLPGPLTIVAPPKEACDPDGLSKLIGDWKASKNGGSSEDKDEGGPGGGNEGNGLGTFGNLAGHIGLGLLLGDVADLYEVVTFRDILTQEKLDWGGWAMSVAGLVIGNGQLYRGALKGGGKALEGIDKSIVDPLISGLKRNGFFGESKIGKTFFGHFEHGPLAAGRVEDTFRSGIYTEILPAPNEKFYRWGSANGSFWSRTPPRSQLDGMHGLAIHPDWGDFNKISVLEIPFGSNFRAYEGAAANQGGKLGTFFAGGGNQVYFEKAVVDSSLFNSSVKTMPVSEWLKIKR